MSKTTTLWKNLIYKIVTERYIFKMMVQLQENIAACMRHTLQISSKSRKLDLQLFRWYLFWCGSFSLLPKGKALIGLAADLRYVAKAMSQLVLVCARPVLNYVEVYIKEVETSEMRDHLDMRKLLKREPPMHTLSLIILYHVSTNLGNEERFVTPRNALPEQ